MIFLRARYYESTVGRFISRDTWGGDYFRPMSYNMWAYAYANPLRYTDPSGEFVLVPVIIGGVIGGVIGGAGYVISHPGQSAGEYARSGAFWRAAGAGAVGGLVSGLMPFGGASLASAIGYGIIGGMTAGAAEQLTFNLLTPCTVWHNNLLEASLVGGFFGGLTAGAAYGFRSFFPRGAGVIIEEPSPRILARNLEAAGVSRPPNSAIHHIVAGTDKRADLARKILLREGIGINDSINGVFLTMNTKVANQTGSAIHSTLHTFAYYNAVNARLASAKPGTVKEVFAKIAKELLANTFPH